jgi:hypothetical protein
MVVQQLPGIALVLTEDEGGFSEDPQRAVSEIVRITRRRAYDVKRSHGTGAGYKPRLLGWYRRSGANLFDLFDQALALLRARRVLQTFTERPHLALSLLLPTQIAFRLSTHVSGFLLKNL